MLTGMIATIWAKAMTNEFMAGLAQFDTLEDAALDADKTTPRHNAGALTKPETAETFKETCPKCRGNGHFMSYGRSRGPCYACKGKGFKVYATSSETRAKARESRAASQERKAQAWREANPDLWRWMCNQRGSFAFANAMCEAVEKYGSLTDNQMSAAKRCADAYVERAERRAREAEERERAKAEAERNAPVCEVAAIERAFDAARGAGIKRPKMKLAGFEFSTAPAHGKNPGALYVKRGATYLGKVHNGKFQCVSACDGATQAAILAACADPEKAAVAYGKQYGVCAICSRELSNPESVARGIGPICASRFGWG